MNAITHSDKEKIIESQIDPETGDSVQDVFSIICRAVRSPDGVKITIPRLLNLFRSGSYKSKLEVIFEDANTKLIKTSNNEFEVLLIKEEQSFPDTSWRKVGFNGMENPFK